MMTRLEFQSRSEVGHFRVAPVLEVGTGGEKVVFDSNREGRFEVYETAATGGKLRRLTSGPDDAAVASWSRDGHWVYFVSNRTGRWEIWKMAADGGDAT